MNHDAATINESFTRLWKALNLDEARHAASGAAAGGDDRDVQDTFIAALAASARQEIVAPVLAMMASAAEKLANTAKSR